MCLKPFVKMCIFVVIQICWSNIENNNDDDGDGDGDDDPCKNALTAIF